MLSLIRLIRLFILFGRNVFGCINAPYVTYRKLAGEKTEAGQTLYIFLLVGTYFTFVSLIRTQVRNPYILTVKFSTLLWAGFLGFAGVISLLYVLGKALGSVAHLKTLFILWSYTLLPTLLWFFTTSFLYLLFPPPRTLSLGGKLYSLLFVAFSLSLLYWKLILYYLSLRFGLLFNLGKIIFVSVFMAIFVAGYALLTYRLGIFRIPFI